MRKYLSILLFLAIPVYAQPVPQFSELPPPPPPPQAAQMTATFPGGVRIQDFARTVLTDVLRAQFIFSSEFLASTDQVGFSASKLNKDNAFSLLSDVLADHGFSVIKKGDYYRVYPSDMQRFEAETDFIYKVKHRDVAYLMAHINPLLGIKTANSTGQNEAPPASKKPQNAEGSIYASASKGDTDTLLLRAPASVISRAEKLLEQLDVPAPRVQLRAYVLETRLGAADGYSVGAVANLLSSRLGIRFGSVPGSNSGSNSGSSSGSSSGAVSSPNLALTFSVSSFDAVAELLSTSNNIRVLTAPSVVARAGATATLSVGASVPTLGAISASGNGETRQSVQYLDTGVILTATPRVFRDMLEIELTQEISDAVQTTTGVSASPTISKSSISTTLSMQPGQVAILGGLALQKDSSSASSFLSLLPFSKSASSSTSDLVIVLHADLI